MKQTPSHDLNIQRILEDAGCNPIMIKEFLNFKKCGKHKEQERLLAIHRENLLEAIHENQKKIDYLDFLIFSLNPNTKI